jgi:hypothetical protein
MSTNNAIQALTKLGLFLAEKNKELEATIIKSQVENPWFTKENYHKAIDFWGETLTKDNLIEFTSKYPTSSNGKRVGIIMAGNIPMVGFHDLMCVVLSSHQAIVKPSSDDKVMMELLVQKMNEYMEDSPKIEIVDRLSAKSIDAVIATGSNNSYRYFDAYFGHLPNIIRKNRSSIAVLDGTESITEIKLLGKDVFEYYGLGCRNVNLIFLPKTIDVRRLLDQWEDYKNIIDHHKYANNHTYHRAIFLMNQEHHLDNDFLLLRERKELHAPLGTLNYWYYENIDEVDKYIENVQDEIQCEASLRNIPFGETQHPKIDDYADGVDTMVFLTQKI